MPRPPPSDTEMRQGRRLLRALLPQARALARKEGVRFRSMSELGQVNLSHIREDSLDAVLIYPAPLGGWHCDVVFRDLGHGLPRAMGSPVHMPHKTRAEAEESAVHRVAGLLAAAMENARSGTDPKEPVFMLHDVCVTLPSKVFAKLESLAPHLMRPYGSAEGAIARLEETLAELLPGGVTLEAIQALPKARRIQLRAVLQGCALHGVLVYPPRRDASPSGQAEAELSRARH